MAEANSFMDVEGEAAEAENSPQAANDDGFDLHSAAQDVNTLITEVRTEVYGRIENANELTETKTISIGKAVDDIVQVAKAQIDEIGETVHTLEARADSTGEGVISRHTKAVSSYVRLVNDQLEQQVRVAEEALEQSVEIVRAGAAIADLADAAKILALNARIESSRLHKKGSRFAVIATEMKMLSDGVDSANNLVRDLATRLQGSLPTIAEQMRSMRQETRAFYKELQEHLVEIEADKQGLQTALNASLSAGDRQLDKILEASQRALSELQFQDPMAQKLQRIDNDLAKAQGNIAEVLGGIVPAEDIPAGKRPFVSDEVDDGEDEMEEGELLLF